MHLKGQFFGEHEIYMLVGTKVEILVLGKVRLHEVLAHLVWLHALFVLLIYLCLRILVTCLNYANVYKPQNLFTREDHDMNMPSIELPIQFLSIEFSLLLG